MTDFDKANLHEARGRLEGIPFFVDDPPRLRLSELRARARRWRKKIGMELLIVDLLGKVSSDTKEKDRWREVALVSHGLKALAKGAATSSRFCRQEFGKFLANSLHGSGRKTAQLSLHLSWCQNTKKTQTNNGRNE